MTEDRIAQMRQRVELPHTLFGRGEVRWLLDKLESALLTAGEAEAPAPRPIAALKQRVDLPHALFDRSEVRWLLNQLDAAEARSAALAAALSREKAELSMLRRRADVHAGGCQFPHGGRCGCGWNLIEAEFDEFDGHTERATWLRNSVRDDHDDVSEELTELRALLTAPISPDTKEP